MQYGATSIQRERASLEIISRRLFVHTPLGGSFFHLNPVVQPERVCACYCLYWVQRWRTFTGRSLVFCFSPSRHDSRFWLVVGNRGCQPSRSSASSSLSPLPRIKTLPLFLDHVNLVLAFDWWETWAQRIIAFPFLLSLSRLPRTKKLSNCGYMCATLLSREEAETCSQQSNGKKTNKLRKKQQYPWIMTSTKKYAHSPLLASSGLKNLCGGRMAFLASTVCGSAERDARSIRGMNCTTALSPPTSTCAQQSSFS